MGGNGWQPIICVLNAAGEALPQSFLLIGSA
jgi:hypothetical protein